VNLLTYMDTECVLLGSRWRFRVNMSFSDEDQIFIENLYVLKVMEQINLLRNIQTKVGDCGDSTNCWKTGTTARKSSSVQPQTAWTDNSTDALIFIFCNIHTQTGHYKKGIGRLVANLLRCNTTKYYSNRSTFDRIITKIKRVNLLLRHRVVVYIMYIM